MKLFDIAFNELIDIEGFLLTTICYLCSKLNYKENDIFYR